MSAFATAPPAAGRLDILHADDDIVALAKPTGLLSVPGKSPDLADCVEARVRAAYPSATMVHRLDMATSGVMVAALNRAAHRHLGLQFERRHVKKTYVARVCGAIGRETGTVDLPLRCDWPNRPKQMVDHERGRPATTHWRVLARETKATRVELSPVTGRSHQLRVHMAELGHPILGDEFYAPPPARQAADRLHLHAERLAFFHPADGRWCEFSVPCPF